MQVAAVLGRANSAVNQGTRYGLGKGGMHPGSPTPAAGGKCDCSGFAAWCLGMSRQTSDQFYKHFNGGWIETTAVWTDIGSSTGIFDQIKEMRPGAVIVYPDKNGHQGHIAIVMDANHIAHCSMGNDKKFGDAIKITDPGVFNGKGSRIGWLVGLVP
jgi:hypothetical protein